MCLTYSSYVERLEIRMSTATKNIKNLIFMIFAFFAVATVAKAEIYFSEKDNQFILNGKIEKGDDIKFSKLIEQYYNVHSIDINSSGGDLFASLKIGEIIRKNKFMIVVSNNSVCQSSCVFIIMGGVERVVDGDIFVHRPYLSSSMPESSFNILDNQFKSMYEVLLNYTKYMNIPVSILDDIIAIPPENMKKLSKREIEKYMLNVRDPVWDEQVVLNEANRFRMKPGEYRSSAKEAEILCYNSLKISNFQNDKDQFYDEIEICKISTITKIKNNVIKMRYYALKNHAGGKSVYWSLPECFSVIILDGAPDCTKMYQLKVDEIIKNKGFISGTLEAASYLKNNGYDQEARELLLPLTNIMNPDAFYLMANLFNFQGEKTLGAKFQASEDEIIHEATKKYQEYYLTKASELGHSRAKVSLANLYLKQDKSKINVAYKLLTEGCIDKDAYCLNSLGKLHLIKESEYFNVLKAREYFIESALNGSRYSIKNIVETYQKNDLKLWSDKKYDLYKWMLIYVKINDLEKPYDRLSLNSERKLLETIKNELSFKDIEIANGFVEEFYSKINKEKSLPNR